MAIPVPKGTKGRDCDIVIRKDSIKVDTPPPPTQLHHLSVYST